MADWEWEEVLTMQTWISLLAENEGSQVIDTQCSKEKFFTTYKRLSCLHTSSTVKPWTRRRNEANVNAHGKKNKRAIKKKKGRARPALAVGSTCYLVGIHLIWIKDHKLICLSLSAVMLVRELASDDQMW